MKPQVFPEERGKSRDWVSESKANRHDWSSLDAYETRVLLEAYWAKIVEQVGGGGGGGATIGSYIMIDNSIYYDSRIRTKKDIKKFYGRNSGVVYIGPNTVGYNPKTDAVWYLDENLQVGGKPLEPVILSENRGFEMSGRFNGFILFSEEFPFTPTFVEYKVSGGVVQDPQTGEYALNVSVVNVESFATTYGIDDIQFYGKVEIYYRGNLIAEQGLANRDIKVPSIGAPNSTFIGETRFGNFQLRKTYEIKVILNYIARGPEGVYLHSDNNAILHKRFQPR